MRPLLAALLLLPAVGFAQTGIVLTVSGAGTSGTLAYNAGGCGNLVAGGWVGTGLTGACTSLNIWTTASTCGTAPSTTNVPADVIVATVSSGSLTSGTASGTFSFSFNTLPSFTTNACGAVVDFTNSLCAAVTLNDTTNSCTGSIITSTPVLTLRYDNVPPVAPTVTIVPLDGQLSVRLAPTDTTDSISFFQVQYAPEPADGGTVTYMGAGGNIPINNPNVTISGLTNGTNYLVRALSIDEATNQSPYSQPMVEAPVVTLGFYANYLNDGGQPGGCGDVAGGGPSALAFVGVLFLVFARRRE